VYSAWPVRVYLGTLLVWVAGQYGFSVFLGSVLACLARFKWGGGGWRDSTGFLVSLALFWQVRYDWNGGVVLQFPFHFL
jgi:hypothetical protein